MPIGKNNDDLNVTGDTFKDGTPVDTTLEQFTNQRGTDITLPHTFGNVEPVADATKDSNPVTWPTPDPEHFGNVFNLGPLVASGFELEDGSGVLLLETGDILLLEAQ